MLWHFPLVPNIMNKIVGLKTAFYILVGSVLLKFDLHVMNYDFSAVKIGYGNLKDWHCKGRKCDTIVL
jgi:hypothetical protein